MNNLDKNQWFTEACKEGGTAISYKIKQKLHEETSPYQSIEIYETETHGNLMILDGFIMLTSRDNFLYHEMISHPAIFSHPNPKNVVIVGGGDCGTLKEVLKHDTVESAWQVEIDERVTRLAEAYFPELCTANHDPRAHFHFGDAVEWVKSQAPESMDIIMIDSTDPIGPGEGLFAQPFYTDCFRLLRDDGIIVHQSESPLFHLDVVIKPMYRNMKAAGFKEIQTLQFPQPCYPSGWWTVTMASKSGQLNAFREEAALAKVFETKYYNGHIHKAAQVRPEFLEKALAEF